MIITISDLRNHGACVKDGVKLYCQRYNLDFKKLIAEGIDSDELLSLDNAIVTSLVQSILAAKGQ